MLPTKLKTVLYTLKLAWDTNRVMAFFLVALLFIQAIMGVAVLWTMGRIINEIVANQFSLITIAMLVSTLAMTLIFPTVFQIAQSIFMDKASIHVGYRFLQSILSMVTIEELEKPKFFQQVTNVRQRLQRDLAGVIIFVSYGAQNLLMGTVLLIVLGMYSWPLVFFLLFTLIPRAQIELEFVSMTDETLEMNDPEARRLSAIRNSMLSRDTVMDALIHNIADLLTKTYENLFDDVSKKINRERNRILNNVLWRTLIFVAGPTISIAWIITQKDINAGNVFLYISAILAMGMSILNGFYNVGVAMRISSFANEIKATLDMDIKKKAKAIPVDSNEFSVQIQDLWFRYNTDTEPLLQGINLTINHGECIALVGENGAGKTTLIKLISGLYYPDKGNIKINNSLLIPDNIPSFRNEMAVLTQDYLRFAGTVAENITFGLCRDEEKLISVLKDVGLYSFVEQLPNKLDTSLSGSFGGTELSGGQWQKIALARVLYRSPKCLILDEPLASLDVESEVEFYQAIRRWSKGRTVIIVSHRLAVNQFVDRILFLKDGKIVQDGTHTNLMQEQGYYSELYIKQLYNLGLLEKEGRIKDEI